jgi:hypothetical protein
VTPSTGASSLSDCLVERGYAWVNGAVTICARDFWCPGGSVTGSGSTATACPSGATTISTGSFSITQCLVPRGYYYVDGVVTICPQSSWCPGGSVSRAGDTIFECPLGSTTPSTGASDLGDCVCEPGYYYNGNAVVICELNKWCAGGSITGAGAVATPCPSTSTTASTGSSTLDQCLVAGGSYLTGGVVTICPVGFYCPGGSWCRHGGDALPWRELQPRRRSRY